MTEPSARAPLRAPIPQELLLWPAEVAQKTDIPAGTRVTGNSGSALAKAGAKVPPICQRPINASICELDGVLFLAWNYVY